MNCAQHTDTPAVAYCRTCGKALCESCKRVVSSAIYCESCIAARMGAGATSTSTAATAAASSGGHVAMAPMPVLAGFFGLIPGVGAMYNGQFIKAFIHVVIFASLVAISHHAGPADAFFGVLGAAFYFYMVFDAFLTAKARLLGQPLPDFLGLNRIFGLPEDNATAASSAPAAASAAAAGPAAAEESSAPPAAAQPASVPHVGEPIGPVILIALGALFLLGNLGWFHARHFWPLILIGLGFWLAYRRVGGRY